jgi:hypothetical protein
MSDPKLTQSNSSKGEHLLIEGEKKPWSQGTVHIFWPSAVATEGDERYVAWCREHAKGELRQPEEILPLQDKKSYESRFCKTCLENAKSAKNVEEPDFLEDVESKIESSS